MPKTAAYSAALVKAKDARLTTGIGIQMTSYGDNCIAVPEWNLKQQYIAQAQNYVWYDGVRVAHPIEPHSSCSSYLKSLRQRQLGN